MFFLNHGNTHAGHARLTMHLQIVSEEFFNHEWGESNSC
jgi:hypothetical protein